MFYKGLGFLVLYTVLVPEYRYLFTPLSLSLSLSLPLSRLEGYLGAHR